MSEHPNGADEAPNHGPKTEPQTNQAPPPYAQAGAVPPGFDPWSPWPGDPHQAYAHPAYVYANGYPPYPHWNTPLPMPPESSGWAHPGQSHGQHAGAGSARGAGVNGLVEEIAGGGSGLSSLSKMLDLDDPDFWKGALLGAAAVVLLTNESVRSAIFKSSGAAKTHGTESTPS